MCKFLENLFIIFIRIKSIQNAWSIYKYCYASWYLELELLNSFQKAIDYLLKEIKVRNLQKYLIFKERFIKAHRRKHISSRFFYSWAPKNGDINMQEVCSSNIIVDLFTKSLSTTTFKKMMRKIGKRRFQSLNWCCR